MTDIAPAFNRLTAAEPSLRVSGRWRGRFEIDAQDVQCSLGRGDWMRLSTLLAGNNEALVWRHCDLALPVKVVAGPSLVAEMPVGEDLVSTFDVLRTALGEGLARLAEGQRELVAAKVSAEGNGTEGIDIEPRQSMFDESAFSWERKKGMLSTRVGTATVVARAIENSVLLRADVLRLNSMTATSTRALGHFVLAANDRFRFVRLGFLSERVVQDIVLPSTLLTPGLIDEAVSAIGGSFRITKRACAALADAGVAEQYLEFHQQGEMYGNTHD